MADKLENFFRPRPPTFYLPGDPRDTHYVEMITRLATAAASLPKHQRPDRMYFSAKDYASLLAECIAQYDTPVNNRTPGYLIIGIRHPFRVLNAGTDDQAEVNRLNRETPGAIDFADRLRKFDVVH